MTGFDCGLCGTRHTNSDPVCLTRFDRDMAEAAEREARNRAAKLPGLTVAESLGIEVPANAPGGQKLAPPMPQAQRHSGSVRGERHVEIDYDGFVDRDGWT